MSIIDNVGDLRARLEEIEAEKAAGISGPVLILNEGDSIGRLEPLMPGSAIEQPDPTNLLGLVLLPPQEPVAWSLQSKAEMLHAQIRLYTRLRAECMQALMDTKARIAVLAGKE